jgi:hypothetical protein
MSIYSLIFDLGHAEILFHAPKEVFKFLVTSHPTERSWLAWIEVRVIML